MGYDSIKDELVKIAKDIIQNNCAPGLPENYITFISKHVQVISGVNGLSTSLTIKEIENAIQTNLSPMALLYGVYANGISRGNFIEKSSFDNADKIIKNKEEDYEVNVNILNYIYSIIAAVNHLDDLKEHEILMISYGGEEDISWIEHFDNLSQLTKTIYEDYGIEKLNNF